MTPQEHAQLLRELADIAFSHGEILSDDGFSDEAGSAFGAFNRARAAAEEIEDREVPTESDLIKEAIRTGLAFQPRDDSDEVYLPFDAADEPLDDLIIAYGRTVLARFGGGEAE